MTVQVVSFLYLSGILLFVNGYSARAQESAPAAPSMENATGDELYDMAEKFFREKNFKDALTAYKLFQTEYGSAPESVNANFNAFYPIAICHVYLSDFPGAIVAINEALTKEPPTPKIKLTDAQRHDLTFWLGMTEFQLKNYAQAREALEKFIALFPAGSEKKSYFVKKNPAAARIGEARSTIGITYILEEKFREAVDYYAKLKPSLSPDARGRAVIFELYALERLGDFDAEMKVVAEEYPKMGDIAQLISFQTMTLRLGNHWFKVGEYRKAILCLQRVWTFDRLIKHQDSRLVDLKSKLKAAEANADDPYAKILYGRLVGEVGRELENFRKTPNFDASMRFRLAIAYLQMKRYREAALIMDNMIDVLPQDPTTEQAAINIIRCWNSLEDLPNMILSAQKFAKLFPASAHLAEARFMEADALLALFRPDEAAAAYLKIAEDFPKNPRAPEARFMRSFALLQAEKNMEAAESFRDFVKRHPDHARAEAAAYWIAMSYSYDKQYEPCRKLVGEYLAKYPDGMYRGQANFRKAYCLQQMEKFPSAIDEFHAYLEAFPGEAENSEARILLGNALMNEGFIEDGIAEFKKIPPDEVKPYEEGVFRTAEALKLLEEYDQYRDFMQEFVDKYPRSTRVGEAIGNLGWYWRKQEQPEKARELYRKAILDLGNDPAIRSVEDLFLPLARFYRTPEEMAQYLDWLRDQTALAEKNKARTLQIRLLWAQAQALRKSDPAQSQNILIQAASKADVREDSPAMLVDFANALLEAKREKDGETMLRDTLRWNPRALQKDRILASLGDIELQRGNETEALALYTRFVKENLGSAIFGPTMLAKAKLHAKRGENTQVRETLDTLLGTETVQTELKAEALFTMGDLYMKENNPAKAVPYFIQVYNMYGRWKPWVAKSYLQSAEALAKLNETDKARRTLQEMLTKTELEELPEFPLAKERLQSLGGPLPPAPADQTAPPTPAQG
jgi:tetratricopeptide (TPR) repeat protein